jgi:excinuclease ABC subunit A
MDKPDVDFIEGLSPAVSIDQKSTNRNPRSTVGTITEVYDYLRLLYARAGTPHCPICGERIARQTPAADRRPGAGDARGHPVPGSRPGGAHPQGRVRRPVREAERQGYSRVRVDGVVHSLTDPTCKLKKYKRSTTSRWWWTG